MEVPLKGTYDMQIPLTQENTRGIVIQVVPAGLAFVLFLALSTLSPVMKVGADVSRNARPIDHAEDVRLFRSPDGTRPHALVDSRGCGLEWHPLSMPNVGSSSSSIGELSVLSENDIWAVGSYRNASNIWQAQSWHWNGVQWTLVPTVQASSSHNELSSVKAISTNDVWAVGAYVDVGSPYRRTFIQHWNGVTWTLVPSPNISVGDNYLLDIAALSSFNVWVVGIGCTGVCPQSPNATAQSLILHWDGVTWSTVASPNYAGQNNYLHSIAAVAADDIWAVGYYNACLGCVGATLMLHWDGTAWTLITSPNAGTSTNYLYSVSAASSSDVWAAGYYYDTVSRIWHGLVLHWDGNAWSTQTVPHVGTGNNFLQDVKAFTSTDVWVVGSWFGVSALTLHWNGVGWSVAPSPNNPGGTNMLNSVDGLSSMSVWAAGYNEQSGFRRTVSQHFYDSCVTPTPTSTSTN